LWKPWVEIQKGEVKREEKGERTLSKEGKRPKERVRIERRRGRGRGLNGDNEKQLASQ